MTGISALLSSIESKSDWLTQDAKALAEFVALLPARRDFPTLAEDAMDRAERQLVDALKTVRASRRAFNSKPVERSHAA